MTRRERNVFNVLKSAINMRENCSNFITARHRDGDSRNYFQVQGPASDEILRDVSQPGLIKTQCRGSSISVSA